MTAIKWIPTPYIDAQIQSIYANGPVKLGEPGKLARRIGWPTHAVTKRAQNLGIARTKEKPWTQEELTILENHAFRGTNAVRNRLKKAGYERSITAIEVKRKRLSINLRDERSVNGLYTAKQLENILKVDRKCITRWINQGLLKAKRRGTLRTDANGGDEWEIRDKDIRHFIIQFTAHAEIALARCNKYWLIDLLANNHD